MIVIALKHTDIQDQYVPLLVSLAQPVLAPKPSQSCLRFDTTESAQAWLDSRYGRSLAILWPGLTPEVVEIKD
jgi:hypothetical protein